MGKFLQKIFKNIFHFIFLKIYGKIDSHIESNQDKRIIIKIVQPRDNLKYKIYKILNGRLYTDRIHDTAVILDNKIIKEPSFQLRHKKDSKIYNSSIKENIVFTKGTPRRLKKINGTILSLLTGGGGNNNYWHWLYDVLPRLALCSKAFSLEEIDFFLFPSIFKKFQEETLDCLNIPKSKRLSSEKFRHIKAKELIITDHPVAVSGDHTNDIQNVPNWILSWLKDSFLKQDILNNKKVKNRIYIDRTDSDIKKPQQRIISNDDQIKEYLLKRDFISVKLHEITFKEQVNLFYNAEYIVGLHGAGLANLVFCQSKTKVVEMRGSNAGIMYETLAKKNSLNYHSVIIEAKQIHKLNYPNQQGSIEVPISSLKKLIEN